MHIHSSAGDGMQRAAIQHPDTDRSRQVTASPAAPTVQLRPYQLQAVDEVRTCMKHVRKVLLVLATGGGKTIIFNYVASAAAAKGSRVLIIVHRKELIRQTVKKFESFGITPGIVGKTPGWELEPVAVGMVVTCSKKELPPYNLLIVDEAHHAVSRSWVKVLEQLPKARVLGVTATPQRLDGRGLGDRFDVMIQGPSCKELTDGGFLAPIQAWGIEDASVKGIRLVGDTFSAEELEKVMGPFTDRALEAWEAHAKGQKTIVFCCSVKHAEFVAERFRRAGYRAQCVHGGMSERERDNIILGFAGDEFEVLTSCDLIDEGFDVPECSCVMQCRPTESIVKHFQQGGRAMRPKKDGGPCVWIDMVGNIAGAGKRKGLGLPDEIVAWSLEGKAFKSRPPGDDKEPKEGGIQRGAPEIEAITKGRMISLRSKLADARGWQEAEAMVENPEDYLTLQRYFPKKDGGRYKNAWIIRRCATRFFPDLDWYSALHAAGSALGLSRMVENSIDRGHRWTMQGDLT